MAESLMDNSCNAALVETSLGSGGENPRTPFVFAQVAEGNAPSRILIVEDEALIALMINQIVTDAGYEVVGPINRLATALELANSQPLSGALLDVNLAGELTWPLARVLKERGIPFTFMTGYAPRGFVPEEFADVALLGKPFEDTQLRAALTSMTGKLQPC